jgi:hypothetical protein
MGLYPLFSLFEPQRHGGTEKTEQAKTQTPFTSLGLEQIAAGHALHAFPLCLCVSVVYGFG